VRRIFVCVLLLAACGRTPTIEPVLLYVAVVDGSDNPATNAEVELRDTSQVIDVRPTDGDGIATFRYPGDGRYMLRAENDPQCCFGEGELDTVITSPDDAVIVVMTIGPCPTWSPPGC
jgi:hypothetical protein